MARYPACVVNASKRSGISKAKLQKSYNRGVGAWKSNYTGPRPKVSKQAWACGRVNKLARLKRRAGYDQDLLR